MSVQKVTNWKKSKVHEGITLPSGTKVSIEIPNLPEFLRAGKVPNDLVKFANDAQEQLQDLVSEFSMEKIKEATDFMRWLTSVTVVEPKIEPEDVPELPTEDVDMVLEFAMRRRDTDEIGHHLAGLEKVDEWNKFRYE